MSVRDGYWPCGSRLGDEVRSVGATPVRRSGVARGGRDVGLAGGPSTTLNTSLTHSRKRRRTSSWITPCCRERASREALTLTFERASLHSRPSGDSLPNSAPGRWRNAPEEHRPAEQLLGTALERHLAPPVSPEGDGRNADLARELADRALRAVRRAKHPPIDCRRARPR